jgi:hypothetical protein
MERNQTWYLIMELDNHPDFAVYISYPSKEVLVTFYCMCELVGESADLVHAVMSTSSFPNRLSHPFQTGVNYDGVEFDLYRVATVNLVKDVLSGNPSSSLFHTSNEQLLDWVHPTAKRVRHLLRNHYNCLKHTD